MGEEGNRGCGKMVLYMYMYKCRWEKRERGGRNAEMSW